MQYSIAHFGNIPHGKTVMGNLYYASPSDGCSSLNQTEIKFEGNENDPSNTPILLIDRGNCTFVTKTKYAQLAGAKMVIIVDNKGENVSNIIMADDGHGTSINIPTILIGKSDGQTIKTFMKESPDKIGAITIVASFPIESNVSEVKADFWYSAGDLSAYEFFGNFSDLVDEFGETLKFTPHYVLWYCGSCEKDEFKIPQDNCLSGGRYCAPDPDGAGPAKGSTVVTEDLRQICIWKSASQDRWWDYTEEFGLTCLDFANEDCYKTVMETIGMSNKEISKVQDCMDESFGSKDADYSLVDNKYLSDELASYADSGIQYWPSIVINHSPYKGDLTPGNLVAEAICEKFTDDSDFCLSLESGSQAGSTEDDADTHYLTIFFILLAMVAVLLLMLYFYKRMMRREMTKEMSIQISQMVSQYFALNEGKAGRNDNL